MQHLLTLGNFNFNGKRIIQPKGCTVRSAASPSYAHIYIDKFKNTYIYPEIKIDYLSYALYIDYIFIIYRGKR